MKKALLAIMAIALVIGFAGCSIFGGAKSPYYPLKEGNKWEYEGTTITSIEYADTTYVKNSYDTTTATSTTEVIGETELTGDNAIKVWEVKSTSGTSSSTSYIDVDKDWVYIYDKIDASTESYKWPNEPKKDDTWEQEIVVDDTTTYKITYTVVEEGVTAFGDYTDCLKIKMVPSNVKLDDYTTYENWMYMTKNTGVVYYYTKMVMGDTTYTMSIESETKLKTFTEG